MAYNARVYRIFVASPSDVEEEREMVVRVIQEWNDLYSNARKIVLLPLRWETHSAPEFGSRPQEIINRSVVDQCDLLVGIFWTRIGSPTGVSVSGTIEEIDRVGNTGKPVLLYFSHVGIDPSSINTDQLSRLEKFKKTTYPNGLIENYKSLGEFRDKFSRQLEMHVRGLESNDRSGVPPLSLQFLSEDAETVVGNSLTKTLSRYKIDLDKQVSDELRPEVQKFADAAVEGLCSFPVLLTLNNTSASGVRNIFGEVEIVSSETAVRMSDSPFGRSGDALYSQMIMMNFGGRLGRRWPEFSHVPNVNKFDSGKLNKNDDGWTFSFEWDALQPKRIQLIKPILYLYAPTTADIHIKAKIYADSFPEPFELEATIHIEVSNKSVELDELFPDWRSVLKEETDLSEEITKRSAKLTKRLKTLTPR